MRESLINKRTQMKNELIAMIDYWGIDKKEGKLFKDEEEDIKWINNLNLNENIKKGIIMNYNMILNMSYNIEKFEELIENILKDNEDYNKIKENIKSIGTISGAYIISKIENIDRFDSSKKLTAYL